MNEQEMLTRLGELVQLDIDAVHAYDQAIKQIDQEDIRQKFEDFRRDHQGHIAVLSRVMRDYKAQPPESADLKGLLLEGLTALRSVTGMKGALQAMETNEKLTNRKYTEAAGLPLPEEILKIVRTNLTHEQRHLGYIQEILTTPRREL